MRETVEQSHVATEKRQRQLDAIDRLAAMEPLPVPESLSEWNREYSRLKVGEAAGCLPLDDRGFWSISISGNWRLIFRFADGDAFDVDLVDYH